MGSLVPDAVADEYILSAKGGLTVAAIGAALVSIALPAGCGIKEKAEIR